MALHLGEVGGSQELKRGEQLEGKGFHKKGKEAKACKGEVPLKNDQELTRKTVFLLLQYR